jgi:UDP-N-acetylglucosamine 4-epimerase
MAKWLVTGVAGFIGSHLLERLLSMGHTVVGVDNFITGQQKNIDAVLAAYPQYAANFQQVSADLRDRAQCLELMREVEIVLHQAAVASVPRSLAHPDITHEHNVDVMFNLLFAAKQCGVKKFVYASSSSVYGDSPLLPKQEEHVGALLSPYAASKRIMETYADVFARVYNMHIVGLRYFNVFGPRQNPHGAYASVIPRWIAAMLAGQPVYINGDGTTSRDFTYVDNVVHINLLAATVEQQPAWHRVYNVGAKQQTTLLQLYKYLAKALDYTAEPVWQAFRSGDVQHSLADISRAQQELGFAPLVALPEGLQRTVAWFKEQQAQ